MPIYRLEGQAPEFPPEGGFYIAETAVLIGRVRLKAEASVWFGAVLRGDNEWIELGERSQIQDNAILHTDPGFPLTIGRECVIGHNVIWSINSLCHCVGSRPHQLPDRSTNFIPLTIISWGESWHNNHHSQPTSARFGQGWRQVDIGWYVIAVLAALGFVFIRQPDTAVSR